MTQINVKLIEIYGGVLSGGSSIIIEVFKAEDSDTKYYSYTESGERHENTQVYVYPEVNPIVYDIINYSKKCGVTRILDDGAICAPHLTRKESYNENGYVIYNINPDEEPSILKSDIVSKFTPIPDQDWFEILVKL